MKDSGQYINIYSLNFYGDAIGGVVLDANGNIFGTSTGGGDYGAVWEITP